MRRMFVGCLAILGTSMLSLPTLAAAVPTVSVSAKIVPIKGFPGTGDKLGAGAAVESHATISGTEYGGFPPPVIGVNVFLPKGTILHPSGFPVCRPEILEPAGPGPKGCPKGSAAGLIGKATGYVAFGDEIVPETATIQPFYAPGGGLEFFAFGHSPVLIEIISKARFVSANGLFSKELIAEVPLVETVPGAQDASVKTISVTVGSAIRKGGKAIYYGRVPKKCPKGGFPAKAEVIFAGLGGLSQTTVTKTLKVPCPRR